RSTIRSLISQFFSSPEGTSERIFLYFAEVHDSDLVGKGGGIDDEDLKVVHMSLDDLFERLANGALEDPKLLVAAYWLLQEQLRSGADRKRLIDLFWDRPKPGVQPAFGVGAIPAAPARLQEEREARRRAEASWQLNRLISAFAKAQSSSPLTKDLFGDYV